MVLIIAFRRYVPRFPGLIFAATITSLGIALAGLPVDTIHSRFGDLPGTLPFPELPQISYGRVVELLPSAMLIAFLAGVESLLSAIVADRLIASRHRSNAELTAQGIANIGSSLFGGLPATGAIARTATNVRAGARTPVSGLVHAAVILLILLVAAPLAGYLAMPVMAGILMLTAWNMAEPGRWRHYAQLPRPELGLLLLTLVLTVVVDLAVAIGVGAGLGLALQAGKGPAKDKDWTPPER
jgi:sulfate permease, SulP family